MKIRYVFVFLISFFLTYCSDNKPDNTILNNSILDDSPKSNLQNYDSLNNLNVLNLRNKYNAIEIENDSSNFTYEFQGLIDSTKLPILIEGFIIDILKSGKGFQLLVSYSYRNLHKIKVIINVDIILFEKLKSDLNGFLTRGSFVIKVNSINSSYPILTSEKATDGEDSDLTYHFSEYLIKINGDLIDYNIHKKIK